MKNLLFLVLMAVLVAAFQPVAYAKSFKAQTAFSVTDQGQLKILKGEGYILDLPDSAGVPDAEFFSRLEIAATPVLPGPNGVVIFAVVYRDPAYQYFLAGDGGEEEISPYIEIYAAGQGVPVLGAITFVDSSDRIGTFVKDAGSNRFKAIEGDADVGKKVTKKIRGSSDI